MTTLHDRLSDLADEAPGTARPGDLWATGRRLHRRRRAGTAVVVAATLVALAGLGGLGWSRSHVSVQPAGADTPLGMPSQIWHASEHLPGTDHTGPIGPLVAVVPTVRDSWHGDSSNGVLGISATGEYAYLDLPHLGSVGPTVGSNTPALSDDGRYVAYWRSGTPSGAPGDTEGDAITGVAAYDTVSGKTYEYDVPTEHGLEPETMVWTGTRLTFDVWQLDEPRDDGVSARRTQVVAWDPVSDADQVWGNDARSISDASVWRGELITTNQRGEVLHGDAGGVDSFGRIDSDKVLLPPFRVSPDGSQVAAQKLNEPNQGPVLTGRLGTSAADTIELTKVPVDIGPYGYLLGWRDDDHLVTIDYSTGTGEATYETVDVTTGAAEILGYAEGNQPILAADALAGPVFEAPEPPSPLNPFLLYGGGIAILLAAGLALRWWRRRVQH